MSSIKNSFDQLSVKKISLGKVYVDATIVDALEYIASNTKASKAEILEDALTKYQIVKKAAKLKKEIEATANNQDQQI